VYEVRGSLLYYPLIDWLIYACIHAWCRHVSVCMCVSLCLYLLISFFIKFLNFFFLRSCKQLWKNSSRIIEASREFNTKSEGQVLPWRWRMKAAVSRFNWYICTSACIWNKDYIGTRQNIHDQFSKRAANVVSLYRTNKGKRNWEQMHEKSLKFHMHEDQLASYIKRLKMR